MSLVNQMLKDLESRRAPEMGGEAVLRDLVVGSVPSVRRRASLTLLIVGGLIVAGAVAAAGYWYTHRPDDGLAAAASVAAVPERPVEPLGAPKPAVAIPPEPAVGAAPAKPAPHPETTARTKHPEPTPATAAETQQVAPVAAVKPAKKASAVKPTPARSVAPVAPKPTTVAAAPVMERVERPQSPREKARAAYLRGSDWVKRGRLSEAETALRRALELDPDSVDAREVLAAVLIRAQRSAEAETLLKAGLERNPSAYTLARMYGRILAGRNATAEAIKMLERSLPAPALDPDYYGLLAALYQRAGAQDKAAEAYRRVLAVAPERGVWWTGLGISLERLNRAGEALQAYRRARESAGMNAQLLTFVDTRIAELTDKQ